MEIVCHFWNFDNFISNLEFEFFSLLFSWFAFFKFSHCWTINSMRQCKKGQFHFCCQSVRISLPNARNDKFLSRPHYWVARALHFALCSSENENVSCLNWKLSVIFETFLFHIFFAGWLPFHFIHGDVDALLVPILFSLAQFHSSLVTFPYK